jgi:broad specificity phosphatase PhoE
MTAQTIMIIRHAEKPEPGADGGVDAGGTPDPKSLTPTGWQRAGAWAEIFKPSLGQSGMLPVPGSVFASAPASHAEIASGQGGSKSRRPLETVTPLAAKLGIEVDLSFTEGNEIALASAVSSISGVVLICWQHEDIATIAQAIDPHDASIPTNWPGERFNVIFRFDRPNAASAWSFRQIVPVMLHGDQSAQI